MRASSQELIGREAERARIAGLLEDGRRGRSTVLVVLGEPGIGKSALLAWATRAADGMNLLTARGMESEADVPFAGLAELCADHLEHIAALPGPQAAALERALARRGGPAGDRFAVGAAVLGLLGMLADHHPVLLAVDDAQWVDQASMDALLFAVRRLRSERVTVLLAARPGGLDAGAVGLPSLQLRSLDDAAARVLLRGAHGELPEAVADVIVGAAWGRPLALQEIPRLLSPAQLAGREPLDTPLPAGPTLERALAARVAGLPVPTRRALLLAAASDTERLQPVLDAIGDLGLGDGPALLEPAERAGVVTLAGRRLVFVHPLLRAAVYHRAPDPDRREAHRALARVTAGDARAWHLARATVGEDPVVAATLEEVARQARLRGAPGAAASALHRAAELTPPGPERSRRLAEGAGDAHIAGREAAALEMLAEASRGAGGPAQAADIDRVRGRILVLRGEPRAAFRLLAASAESVRDQDPERAAVMLAEATLDALGGGEIPLALATARDAAQLAERAGPGVQAFAGCMLATALTLSGEAAEAEVLIDRAAPLLLRADPLTEAGALLAQTAQCCVWLERYDVASHLLERLVRAARAAGAPTALPWPLVARAVLHTRLGQWSAAEADAEESLSLAEQTGQLAITAHALSCLARIAAGRGQEEVCRERAERAARLGERHHIEPGRVFVPAALGLLELGLGRIEPALAHLEEARATTARHGAREPRATVWHADLVEALVREGGTAAAATVLEDLTERGEHTGGRWTLGTAARCRGLLTHGDEAEGCFAASLAHLEALPDPFEVARTHLCRGEWLRRTGRRTDARAALEVAVDGFDRLGAEPWGTRARQELRATGATARRRQDQAGDELTPQELQIACIVASGASNREAAAALFLSRKTIEFHLSHIYRKLGVRSRSELAGLAARERWLEDDPPRGSARSAGARGAVPAPAGTPPA